MNNVWSHCITSSTGVIPATWNCENESCTPCMEKKRQHKILEKSEQDMEMEMLFVVKFIEEQKKSIRYYVPDIEEFHVGFEYERMNGENWEKDEIGIWDIISSPHGDYENEMEEINRSLRSVRVKYLDSVDIEDLGWKPFLNSTNEYFINASLGEQYQLIRYKDKWIIEYIDHTDDHDKVERLFKGKIKNKSELKKIMNQIEIIQ